MRRTLVALLLTLLAGLAGLLLYATASREADYRRLIGEGERALRADQAFLAIEAFSGAIALKGETMLGYLKRGESYRQRGELSAALRDLRTAARLDPTATRPLELAGDVNLALERYARAADDYEAYVRLDDRSARVLYKLGVTRFRAGDPVKAAEAVRRALVVSDDFPEAHYLLGLCLSEMGRTDEATVSLERAIQLAPGSLPAREQLALLHRRAGNDARAAQEFLQLAALEPGRPERMVAVGLSYSRIGRTDLAVVALSQAAERFPDETGVYVALGRVWLEAAEPRRDRVALSKAMAALDRTARGQAATSEALTLLGRAQVLAGNLVEAERVLVRATSTYPLDPSAFLHLASTSRRLGHVGAARTALLRYAALAGEGPELGRVAPEIADLSLRLGEPAEAARWYARATELLGDTTANLVRLADAQLRAGDSAGARATLARGLGKEPDDPALQALSRRLSRLAASR